MSCQYKIYHWPLETIPFPPPIFLSTPTINRKIPPPPPPPPLFASKPSEYPLITSNNNIAVLSIVLKFDH